jgi:hypothetical protein
VLLKKTISPIGKCGPSQRTAANMIANMSMAMILHSIPRNGLSLAASKPLASALIDSRFLAQSQPRRLK